MERKLKASQFVVAVFCVLFCDQVVGFQPSVPSSRLSSFSPTRPRRETSVKLSTRDESKHGASIRLSRRQVIEVSVAATGLGVSVAGTREVDDTDYGLWGVLPFGTYRRKKTIRETTIPDQVWTFDQRLGIFNLQVPLRMTILKLSSGGLLVYNPVAATRECLNLVKEIVDRYGPIQHIVVGSVALEHKVYAGVFAQKFPDATVWLTPGQYSFPVNLPDSPFLGFPVGRTRTLPSSIEQAPPEWQRDLDFAILGPIINRDGAFGETVLFHKPTQTLVVTDTCLQVTDEVPAIFDYDPAPLLYHARDTITDIVQDTPETRKKGWKRIVLFSLFFKPSAITVKDLSTALKERRPDINPDFGGVYSWDWVGDEEASWLALTGTDGDKPLVAPILQMLLLNRSPVEVLDFADRVSKWPFTRIIPAHLKNNLPLTGLEYRKSFDFLTVLGVPPGYPRPLPADLEALVDAESILVQSGAIPPHPPQIGGEYSRAEIIEHTIYLCRGNVCAPKASPQTV